MISVLFSVVIRREDWLNENNFRLCKNRKIKGIYEKMEGTSSNSDLKGIEGLTVYDQDKFEERVSKNLRYFHIVYVFQKVQTFSHHQNQWNLLVRNTNQ